MFFTSLITPMILLVLYGTFLSGVYEDAFRSSLQVVGVYVSDKVLWGCVGGQLVSSLLAVSCVTVSFCSNLLMVQDRVSGARRDLMIAPVSPSTLALSYYLSTLVSTLLICFAATGVCLIYLACVGWYLSVLDVFALLLDVILLVLFGTALSSCIVFPLSTNGQASAVGTIISSAYGFICGAYMPISSFPEGLQKVISFLPGTYGTSLLHNHWMRGALDEMGSSGVPSQVIDAIRDGIDCNIYFSGEAVSQGTMYLILAGSVVVVTEAYVLIHALCKPRYGDR